MCIHGIDVYILYNYVFVSVSADLIVYKRLILFRMYVTGARYFVLLYMSILCKTLIPCHCICSQ